MKLRALKTDYIDKRVITFFIDKKIKEDLNKLLIESNKYNLKKKSDWINEAIMMLKDTGNYKEIVYRAEVNENLDNVRDKIKMTFDQRKNFSEIRNEVVKAYPDIKGPHGAIIRAAISNRLIRRI